MACCNSIVIPSLPTHQHQFVWIRRDLTRGVHVARGQGTAWKQCNLIHLKHQDSPRQSTQCRLSWSGLRWFRKSRRITFDFLLFSFLATTIGRCNVLKFSGIEGEGHGTLGYKSQSECDSLAHCNHTSFVKLTSIMAPN